MYRISKATNVKFKVEKYANLLHIVNSFKEKETYMQKRKNRNYTYQLISIFQRSYRKVGLPVGYLNMILICSPKQPKLSES